VLDADIRDFFTSLDHGWLEKFCEHRIGDRRVLRLIQKWVEAGVVEDGSWAESEGRTPQGATVSPLLANVYLHYVFDQWVERWRRRQARGDMIVVRYADDFVVGFEHRAGAERFLAELSERFAKFGLELKVEKTRLIEFGRFAAVNRAAPAWASGDVQLPGLHAHQRQDQDRVLRGQANHGRQADAGEVERGQGRTHAVAASTHPEGRTVVGELVRGHIAYYAVPGNLDAVRAFCEEVKRLWLRTLRRRSQRHKTTWERMQRLADRWLPKLRVLHPYPEQRFDATTRGRSPVR
jgi:RNA-directed DNA polymerase